MKNKVTRTGFLILTFIAFIAIADSQKPGATEDKDDLARVVQEIQKELNVVKDELEDRVAKLEDLAKVGTLRSCAEYAKYGLKSSGPYMVDPDGSLLGEEPFQVYCDFTTGATEVFHDTEALTEVKHCHDPGCYNKTITYINGNDMSSVALSQIVSLIELSESCTQEIRYDCTLAPLVDHDINYAYWEDRQGEQNTYYTGSNYGTHVCNCHFEETQCIDEEIEGNTCNCDANLPIPSFDEGTITNMTSLPVMRMFFGGLSYDLQYAAFTLGRLKCYGENNVDVATSCSALKMKGILTSGYYNIKDQDDAYASLVYCDMQSGTYTDVPQEKQPSDDSPIGTILAWVSKPEENLSAVSSLPEGWLPCNGSTITDGPWIGGKTPDLNGGHFLRGGGDNEMLTFESDQIEDHDHVDNGHSHTASSSASQHHHSYADQFVDYNYGDWFGWLGCGCSTYRGKYKSESKSSNSASVSVSTTVSSTTSGLSGVSSSYSAGSETRPRNMRVQWVMRCW